MNATPWKAALGAVVVAGCLQFWQPSRTNPPADPAASFAMVAKPAPEIAAIVGRACKDCHSNETAWPWYSQVSPVSWLVARDVERGRKHLNLSEWNRYSGEMSRIRMVEMCEVVKAGKMPLKQYTLIHPEARLEAKDVSALCAVSTAER